ncbi:hypothetical protein HMPREF9458_03284, partial [Eggerthella lenta 1_1_60AFAA]
MAATVTDCLKKFSSGNDFRT